MTVTNSAPIVITDGYHNRIALGANGQLFVGARTCTEITFPIRLTRCAAAFHLQHADRRVVIPPANGDVTGIQPIANRTVVYVVQGGELNIYDTATDALEYNPNDPNKPGQISTWSASSSTSRRLTF